MNQKTIILNDFKKFWIQDSPQGSIITLCYGKKEHVMKIDCRWGDRKRVTGGRVVSKK